MKNIEFWNSIKNFDEHKNMNGEELICDKVVKEGLGQVNLQDFPKFPLSLSNTTNVKSKKFHLSKTCNVKTLTPSKRQRQCALLWTITV